MNSRYDTRVSGGTKILLHEKDIGGLSEGSVSAIFISMKLTRTKFETPY